MTLSIKSVLLLCLFFSKSIRANGVEQTSSTQSATVPVQPQSAVQSSQNSGKYTIEVQTQAVVLDVLVTDKQGHPVKALQRGDFTVIEDRVPQQILYFESKDERTQTSPVHSTAELDKVSPDAPVTLIVLDELTGGSGDELYTRQSVKRYLDTEGERLPMPTMLLAVNLYGVAVLQDYTTSRTELLATLARHLPAHDARAQDPNWRDQTFNASMHALIGVAHATAGHRGHKNVVWIGKGAPEMPDSTYDGIYPGEFDSMMEEAANALRDARITLYSVDPAGMTPGPERQTYDLHGGSLTAGVGMPAENVLSGSYSFRSIVSLTGGKNYAGGNNLDKLIAQGVNAGENFYTLTYRPTAKRDASHMFHTIEIVMKDPNLRATTREGYFSGAREVPPVIDAKGRMSQKAVVDIGTAARGVMVYDAVPFTISRSAEADSFVLSLKANSLQWTLGNDGKQTSDLAVITVVFDRNGKQLSQSGRMATVSLPATDGSDAEARRVNLAVSVPAGEPAARVRFILRTPDGQLGADNFFLVDKEQLHDPAIGLKAGPQR